MQKTIQEITARLEQATTDQIFPGCVVGIVHKDGSKNIVSTGFHTYEMQAQAVQDNSIFDVASLTKSIPTASLALKAIEEGKLKIEDKVCDYLPALQNAHRNEILVKHLLTFTILLDLKAPLSSHKHETPDAILELIHTSELKAAPGAIYAYSNSPSILLGLIVEKVYNKPLDILANKFFFQPLGMKDSSFTPTNKARIVPTEIDEERGGLLHGTVHDESAYALQKQFVPGNAGLFTTVPDLLIFLEMLLNQGILHGKQYFKPETVRLMHTNQIANIGQSTGLGWELNQPRYMGKFADENTFGKTGFTGCLVICNIQKGIAFAMLSNYVHPKRKPDATLINQVRSDIANIILR